MSQVTRRTRTLRAWVCGLAFLVGVLVGIRRAEAEPSTLDVSWTAPPECPDRAWLESAVLHLVTAAPSRSLKVTGQIREVDGRYRVDLELQGAASGKRTLSAASCGSVSRGAALIIALALDPQASPLGLDEAAAAPSPASPIEPAEPEPLPPSSPPARPEPTPVAPSWSPAPSKVRPLVFAGVGAVRAYLPATALSVVAGGGITWRALRVDLSAELEPSVREPLVNRPTIGADFSLAAVAVRSCVAQESTWIALYGCAALRGVRIAGEGTGLAAAQRNTAYLVAVEPGAVVRFPARTQLAMELEGAAAIPLARPDFVILTNGPSDLVYRVSAIGARVTLGAGVRF